MLSKDALSLAILKKITTTQSGQFFSVAECRVQKLASTSAIASGVIKRGLLDNPPFSSMMFPARNLHVLGDFRIFATFEDTEGCNCLKL